MVRRDDGVLDAGAGELREATGDVADRAFHLAGGVDLARTDEHELGPRDPLLGLSIGVENGPRIGVQN